MKKIILFITIFIFLIASQLVLGEFINSPPNPPSIDGPTSGQIGVTYAYYFTLTDPDYDDLMFNLEVDFGNNIIAEVCGCDKSWTNGTIVEITYQWSKQSDYNIRARVQGEYGDWSEWSEPYIVKMPYNLNNYYFNCIIHRLSTSFPTIAKFFEKYFIFVV
jgi:hypothetical protein